MSPLLIPALLTAILFGSALSIQIMMIPPLMTRISDRSSVTRVANEVLRRHHMLSILLLLPATILLAIGSELPLAGFAGVLLILNVYQRFWIFVKLHVIKQPIGVQDLIQPDNVLREESNRLQRRVYLFFRVHLIGLFLVLLWLIYAAL